MDEKRRYVFAGDSFTMGGGINKPFPDYLEEQVLNNSIECINIGYGGADIGDYYRRLSYKGLKYKPDVVFVGLWLGNDFDEKVTLAKPKKTIGWILTSMRMHCYNKLQICHFFSIGIEKLISLYKGQSCITDNNYREIINSFYNASLSFDSLSKTHNFTLVYLMIPTKEALEPKKERLVNHTLGCQLMPIEEDLEHFFRESGINYLNVGEKLRDKGGNTSLFFSNDIHMNQKGHIEVAGIIYEYLVSEELLGDI